MPDAFLAAAYGGLPLPVVVTECDGRLRYANPAAERRLGLGGAVGAPLGTRLTITHPDVSFEAVHAFARARGEWDGQVFVKPPGEAPLPARWSLSTLLLPDGTRAFLSVVHLDRGPPAHLLTAAMESLQVGVIVRDAEARVLYVNPLIRTLSGHDDRVLDDRGSITEKLHPDDRAGFAEMWDKAFRDRQNHVAEFRGMIADDTVRWFRNEVYWSPDREVVVGLLYDIHDRRSAEEGLRRAHEELEERVRERTADLEAAKRALEADVTARERAEQERDRLGRELRRSQVLEAVGRLAGGVAHDFNNLLGSVLGCLYHARLNAGDNRAVLAELDAAQALCKQGGEVTRQLLTVARRRFGREESLSVEALLREAHSLFERTLPKQIRLAFTLGPDLPRVRGDGSLLASALLNLCLNARDAMPGGGTLTLTGHRIAFDPDRSGVQIDISDTGGGIPLAIQDKIFEPFFTTKAPDEGSGMGLAMAYAAVRDCGGELSVRSAPGEGATLSIRLPAERGEPPPRAEAGPAHPAKHPVTDGLVLVVEDEDEVARLMLATLGRHGYETRRAATGLLALEALKAHRERVALVTLDLMLPELGGQEVYRLLASLAPELRVLFVTGREDLARQLAPGGPVLGKPFDDAELLAAVAAALGGPRPEESPAAA